MRLQAPCSPIQRVVVHVGFDASPTQSMYGTAADTLTTAGVANCIAIVAWDVPGYGAVMRHYDTNNAVAAQVPDPVSGGNALTFSQPALNAVRAALDAQLLANVPPGVNINYSVALGGLWADVDQGTARWQSRHNLITDIIAVFGTEPTIATGNPSFDVANRAFV